MQVKVKKLHPKAIIPKYATAGAACFDLHATEGGTVMDYSSRAFSTGLAFEVPAGFVLMVYSRSGHGLKNGLRLSNCVGIIDSDYRGELKVNFHNDKATPFSFEPGDRIAQALIVQIPVIEFVEASDLSKTARGEGGFGSTGAA